MKREGKSSRILTFDLLRGYFLVSIILNHLHRYPNGLDWIAMRGWLFTSAAEGFFAVSGIILGIVRGAGLRSEPFNIAAAMLLKRGLLLYVWTVGLALTYTLIGWQFLDAPRLKEGLYPIDGSATELLWRAFTLQYMYGWADFLRFYAIFLFVSPLALWLLRAQLWYLLVAISVLCWLFVPVYSAVDEPWRWQILFFGGMTIGYHWQDVTSWWSALSKKRRNGVIYTILGLALVTFIANMFVAFGQKIFEVAGAPDIAQTIRDLKIQLMPYFDKSTLAPARLGLFALWFSAAFYVFQRFEAVIVRWFGWLLLTFGQNSLYVYILHSFAVLMLDLLIPTRQLLLNIVISFATLAVIWLMVRKKVLMRYIPR